jgi:hypothetical protein
MPDFAREALVQTTALSRNRPSHSATPRGKDSTEPSNGGPIWAC